MAVFYIVGGFFVLFALIQLSGMRKEKNGLAEMSKESRDRKQRNRRFTNSEKIEKEEILNLKKRQKHLMAMNHNVNVENREVIDSLEYKSAVKMLGSKVLAKMYDDEQKALDRQAENEAYDRQEVAWRIGNLKKFGRGKKYHNRERKNKEEITKDKNRLK